MLNPTKTASYDVTVLEGVDTSALEQAIRDAGAYSSSAYTAESFEALQAAVRAGQDLIAAGGYSANDVAAAAVATQDAIDALEMRPVDETTLINTDAETSVTVVDASSDAGAIEGAYPGRVLDYNDQSYWHSDYNNAVYMPQYLIFDLAAEYDLTDVTFLPRQNGTNGDIFEVEILSAASAEDLQAYADNGYEAAEDSTVVSLGTFTYANDGKNLTNRTAWQQAAFALQTTRYVMFKVNHAGGDVPDRYCSASEIRFYGTKHEDPAAVDKTALQQLVDEIEAAGLNAEDYAEATWTPFANALADARRALADDAAT
ncbi:MAG: discoidin domain-containing protein [Atopobiaceae bacterium]|nr:discoidin domain-containing protein [Atopobiaceae bacterium]